MTPSVKKTKSRKKSRSGTAPIAHTLAQFSHTVMQGVLPERYPFLASSRRADATTDYDELASEQQWPPLQASMFRRTVKLLEASHLARMAHLKSDELGG
jgi:hypothetical protein